MEPTSCDTKLPQITGEEDWSPGKDFAYEGEWKKYMQLFIDLETIYPHNPYEEYTQGWTLIKR